MNAEEAGAYLGRSRTTILRWFAENRLAGQSYFGRVTFAREDIERIKESGKIPNPKPANALRVPPTVKRPAGTGAR